jgi:hypothetical protein
VVRPDAAYAWLSPDKDYCSFAKRSASGAVISWLFSSAPVLGSPVPPEDALSEDDLSAALRAVVEVSARRTRAAPARVPRGCVRLLCGPAEVPLAARTGRQWLADVEGRGCNAHADRPHLPGGSGPSARGMARRDALQPDSQIIALLCDFCNLDDAAAAHLFSAWLVGTQPAAGLMSFDRSRLRSSHSARRAWPS